MDLKLTWPIWNVAFRSLAACLLSLKCGKGIAIGIDAASSLGGAGICLRMGLVTGLR